MNISKEFVSSNQPRSISSDERSAMTTRTKEDASRFVPKERTLPVVRTAVQNCRGCDLYHYITQAVFGELETGLSATKPKVSIMMIGEQPEDSEDKEGRPFVGPAGRLLDQCLEEAGIDTRMSCVVRNR